MSGFAAGPPIIHIKRKRDDVPVDSLYIESKRARRIIATPLRFRRLNDPLPTPPPAAHIRSSTTTTKDGIPTVITTQPGDETRDPLALSYSGVRRAPLAIQARGPDGERIFEIKSKAISDPMEVDNKDEEGQFVYDVFVRYDDSIEHTAPIDGTIGTLYIPVGAEEEWGGQEYGVGGEEDEKTQTDDEDSNAEDYYGADYPEEEDDDDNDEDGYRERGYGDDDDDDDRGNDVDYRGDEAAYIADYDDQFKAMSHRY